MAQGDRLGMRLCDEIPSPVLKEAEIVQIIVGKRKVITSGHNVFNRQSDARERACGRCAIHPRGSPGDFVSTRGRSLVCGLPGFACAGSGTGSRRSSLWKMMKVMAEAAELPSLAKGQIADIAD